jgi:chromosome segregation ATPase
VKSGPFGFVFETEISAMEGNSMNMAEVRQVFRTPVRILLPKLLKSREAWKAKSDRRKAQLKAAKIKIRDCSASREMWRQRAEQLAEENRQLREQLEQAEQERTQMQTPLAEVDAQKK